MRSIVALLFVATACAHSPHATGGEDQLAPMLAEIIRFPTVVGNDQARKDEQQWILRKARELGLVAREAGLVTEVELPGPAPVLGLIAHGDVQPVDDRQWTIPPFAGAIAEGYVLGRGAADDKGPIVQALLAMAALKNEPRTMTLRLMVGSDEESNNLDMKQYLESHKAPDYSLVIDSDFPADIGEKAWDGLAVQPVNEEQAFDKPWVIETIEAGLAPSIVPDLAQVTLKWREGKPDWEPLEKRLQAKKFDPGTALELKAQADKLEVIVHGHAAHAGVSIEQGRNALVSLAKILDGEVPDGALKDLFQFIAAQDIRGQALHLTNAREGWGGYQVNVATLKRDKNFGDKYTLVINLRRPPPLTAKQAQEFDFQQVKQFSPRLVPLAFYFGDEPLVFDPEIKIVKRLMADYAQAMGAPAPPAISGGGTYAKRVPNSIAFGMWFPDKPYPGHSADEKISITDLRRGYEVLLFTLRDLLSHPPIEKPFSP